MDMGNGNIMPALSAFIPILIEGGIRLISALFGFFKADEEKKKWLRSVSDTLFKKGLVRSRFIIELEQSDEAYLNKKLDELDRLDRLDREDERNKKLIKKQD